MDPIPTIRFRRGRHCVTGPDPLVVFLARAEARASLCAAGLHDLQDSVDTLQAAAETQGLVSKYGQDRVQELLAEAFGRWRLADE
jgi:hypothetical protein